MGHRARWGGWQRRVASLCVGSSCVGQMSGWATYEGSMSVPRRFGGGQCACNGVASSRRSPCWIT